MGKHKDHFTQENILKMRTDLALVLGWKQTKNGHWKFKDEIFSLAAPDYFYNLGDGEELKVWLTTDDNRWFEYRLELAAVLEEFKLWPEDWSFERALISAPQKYLAFAAWKLLKVPQNKKVYLYCPNEECGNFKIDEAGSLCPKCNTPMEPDQVEPE